MVLLFFYNSANNNEGRYFCEEQSFTIHSVGKPGFFSLNTSALLLKDFCHTRSFCKSIQSSVLRRKPLARGTQCGAFVFKSVKKTD